MQKLFGRPGLATAEEGTALSWHSDSRSICLLSVFVFLLHKTDAMREGEWGTCFSMLMCGLSASVWCVHFRI